MGKPTEGGCSTNGFIHKDHAQKGDVPQREFSTRNMRWMGDDPKEDTTERVIPKKGHATEWRNPQQRRLPEKWVVTEWGLPRRAMPKRGHHPEEQPTKTGICTGPQKNRASPCWVGYRFGRGLPQKGAWPGKGDAPGLGMHKKGHAPAEWCTSKGTHQKTIAQYVIAQRKERCPAKAFAPE